LGSAQIPYAHCSPFFEGHEDYDKTGNLCGNGPCWPPLHLREPLQSALLHDRGVTWNNVLECRCGKGHTHTETKAGKALANAAVYPRSTARAFAKVLADSRKMSYGIGVTTAKFNQAVAMHEQHYRDLHGVTDKKTYGKHMSDAGLEQCVRFR
jgi:hypothetical protein